MQDPRTPRRPLDPAVHGARPGSLRTVLDSITRWIPPIHREGYVFIAMFAAAAVVLFWIAEGLGWIALFLTLWCAAFFRDPVRQVPLDAGLVVSPADGLVSFVGPAVPAVELGLGSEPRMRVSVFMSVFDCHVNRAPVAGTIRRIVYTPGLFLNADLDKASEDNERNSLVIEATDGREFGGRVDVYLPKGVTPLVAPGQRTIAGETPIASSDAAPRQFRAV